MKYVLVIWAMLQPGDIVLHGGEGELAWFVRRAGPQIVEIRCDTPEECVYRSYTYYARLGDPPDHLYCIDGQHVREIEIPDMPIMSNEGKEEKQSLCKTHRISS